MRVRGELAEIRAQQLRFSEDEAATFFQQASDLGLDESTVQRLRKRTEGWVAGLQMAAISLVNNPDRDTFVQQFAGSHRYVADYLIEEVLACQPEDLQQFLLKTAILNRFNADLCQAVTEEANSKSLLSQLEQANLFLIPLDANRNWYRYHHLFRDFLRHRLQQQDPDLLPQLYQQASHWLEQNSLISEAIDMALVVDDYARVADLIEQIAQSKEF